MISNRSASTADNKTHTVVIVGGGAAGISVASIQHSQTR